MSVITGNLENVKTEAKESLSLVHLLFLLFWILKPFYIGASGGMQISDFVFILSFVMWVVQNRGSIAIDRKDLYFVAFVVCTFVINGIYFAIYKNTGFVLSSLYYLYNLFIVLITRDFIKNKTFLKSLLLASGLNLVIQLVIFLLGKGSYLVGNLRFMGTFNDPNQFSFSMFTAFLVIYLLSSYFKDREINRKKAWLFVAFLLVFYFIFQGSSTGMLMGIVLFAGLMIFVFMLSEKTPAFILLRGTMIAVILAAGLFLLLRGGLSGNPNQTGNSDIFLIQRVTEKLNSLDNNGILAFFTDRGIDKALYHPEYFFFGAGEALYSRFRGIPYEIHSTPIAIFFCYGILPFILLIKWIHVNLKGASKTLIPVFLALLIESFTLAHQRQPVLWMLIVLGSLAFENKELRKYRIIKEI